MQNYQPLPSNEEIQTFFQKVLYCMPLPVLTNASHISLLGLSVAEKRLATAAALKLRLLLLSIAPFFSAYYLMTGAAWHEFLEFVSQVVKSVPCKRFQQDDAACLNRGQDELVRSALGCQWLVAGTAAPGPLCVVREGCEEPGAFYVDAASRDHELQQNPLCLKRTCLGSCL